MRTLWRLAPALLLVIGASHGAEPAFLGTWRVTAVVDATSITAMSGERAARLVGALLTLAPNAVRFAGTHCDVDSYPISRENPTQFFPREYGMPAKHLRLPNPVQHVDAGCTDLFLRDSSHLLFVWDGIVFSATKQAPLRPPPAKHRQR